MIARAPAEEVALREAAFRIANERMFVWDDPGPPDAAQLFYCECAVPHCRERIRLRL